MNVSKPVALSIAVSNVEAQAKPQVMAVAVLAFALGATLVFAAGFAETGALHDAAHDSRHSLAFPCH